MSPGLLELALKKQRLRLKSADLRSTFADQAGAWAPAFSAVDRVQAGIAWLRRHPALPVAALVALLVARPRAALRLAGRSWLFWRGVQRLRGAFMGVRAAGPGGR